MKKNELIDAFHSIDDDMIEEVNQLRQKHSKQKKKWIKYLAAAACVCVVLAGLFQIGGNETDFTSQVTVYAKEMHADNKIELTETYTVIAEYSLLDSKIPALMFHIDYPANDVTYRVTASEGQLLKYDVSEEGIWDVTANGTELEYGKDENVFWKPAGKLDAEVQIAIEVLKDDKVIGNQKVIIEENDKPAFVAKIANGE